MFITLASAIPRYRWSGDITSDAQESEWSVWKGPKCATSISPQYLYSWDVNNEIRISLAFGMRVLLLKIGSALRSVLSVPCADLST